MATDSKARFLRDAEKCVLQGKTRQAINEYLKIIRDDPNDVLTMNTIGDLYLREGRISEATKYFAQVAENYTRNNFLLKAIAVYKKILNSDANNLDINRVVAELYVRQGLVVEARHQYLRIAEICARQGNSEESVAAFEKVAELDPGNSSVRLKLAEIYLADGARDKAQACFAGAAKAQAKTGDHAAAAQSYRRALDLTPTDPEVMRGYVETAVQLGNVSMAIEQLNRALQVAPDDVPLRQLLGRTYLSISDPRSAAEAFMAVLARDESQFRDFLSLGKAFLAAGDVDAAARSLDPVISMLISRRATDQAVEVYDLILNGRPDHEPTLTRLADVYSATNNHFRYTEVLDRLVDIEMERGNPNAAIGFLEKVLQFNPRSEKHLKLHQEAFALAFPETPYEPPSFTVEAPVDPATAFAMSVSADSPAPEGEQADARFVEIDLLLNYGMKARALERLQALEDQDPGSKDVRLRLLSLYKEARRNRDAAEQCVLLAAVCRRARDEDSAQEYIAEARKLAPEWVVPGFDITDFARARRVPIDRRKPQENAPMASEDEALEIDLSEDISEVFFKDSAGHSPAASPPPAAAPAAIAEEYAPGMAPRAPAAESLTDKLQEVDFYLRLGFHDEARAKLDEIAATSPGHPELESRYCQLSEAGFQPAQPDPIETTEAPSAAADTEGENPENAAELDAVVNRFVEEYFQAPAGDQPADATSATVQPAPSPEAPVSRQAPAPHDEKKKRVNEMFADVIEEVNTLEDDATTNESFDTHFGLGVAYKEMNLVEEAIKEFEAAAKSLDPARHAPKIIQCCGMLSGCYLEKGMARSALRWCQTGLGLSDISPHEEMALRYDMGVAHSLAGDLQKALECFGELFESDPTYRDVARKIDSLKSTSQRHGA
jgi:tetratricopeptide (TPR) repeat protein